MAAQTIDLGRVVGEQWFMHARGTSQEAVPAGTITKLTLSERLNFNGGSMRISEDGGIEVLKDGVYKVTADMYMNHAANQTRKGVYVYQGDGWEHAREVCGVYSDVGIAGHIQCVGCVTAAANDIFYIAGRAYGADSTAATRWLLVERIK